jgi:hypothetical protein
MGRPQQVLERDGSPVREFAFWLRDLRSSTGLTYHQLGVKAHCATSTVQAAASGRRLPTQKVALAFVGACGGDVGAWRDYWIQIRRATDPDAPRGRKFSIQPPWAQDPEPAAPARAPSGNGRPDTDPGEPGESQAGDADDWDVKSFTALLRLNTDPPEAIERRVIVARTAGLRELETSISVPRHPDDSSLSHQLDAELLYGGTLQLRDTPYESYFTNVIVLPAPLGAGDEHEYELQLRIPPGQPMACHYVHVPYHRTEYFNLRVRFCLSSLPRAVWMLDAAPTAAIYERGPSAPVLAPNSAGEVQVSFRHLRIGMGYGICWQA